MQIGKRFVIIGLLALLALQAVFVVGDYFKSAALKTPFGWQDEGYVLGPALKVFDEGWKNYRCRGDQIICYGAVHTFFDVLLLRALPEGWLKESPLMTPPGAEWFYQSKYPNAFLSLRIFRVILTLFLMGVVGWIAARSFRSRLLGWVWALALPSFETFRASRSGLKNDFSFSLYLIFFLVLASGALSSRNPNSRRYYFLAAVAAGVIGISIKFGIILPLAIFIPTYFVSALSRGSSKRVILFDFGLAGVLGVIAFLFTNPAFFVNLGEANWFSSFLAATGRTPTGHERNTEFFKTLLPNVWPLPFFIFVLFGSFRKENLSDKIRWFYLFGVPIVWVFLTWKSAYHRSAYYLPILVWVMVVGAWISYRNRTLPYVMAGLLGFQAWIAIPFDSDAWASLFERGVSRFSVEPWRMFQCEAEGCSPGRWVIDRTVRAGVPRNLGESNVLFFDSLTDSPWNLQRKIMEKWPNLGGEDLKILVTCWKCPPSLPTDPIEYYSPAAETWSKVLGKECVDLHPLNANEVFAFENGWRPSAYRVLSLKNLQKNARKRGDGNQPLVLAREGLSPRMLMGSWQGVDSWYAPVILKSSATLEGEFIFPDGMSEASLSFESTCKGEGSVELEVSDQKKNRSADTRMELCLKRPWVCHLQLENWWTERILLEPLSVRTMIHRGGRANIRVSVRGGNPDRCRISLKNIHFTSFKSSSKVDP